MEHEAKIICSYLRQTRKCVRINCPIGPARLLRFSRERKAKNKKKILSKKNRVQIEMKGGGVQGIANEEGNTRAVRVCVCARGGVRVCGCVGACRCAVETFHFHCNFHPPFQLCLCFLSFCCCGG